MYSVNIFLKDLFAERKATKKVLSDMDIISN